MPRSDLPEEPKVWRPKGYPTEDCLSHPNMIWEWDGYGWICTACVMGLDDIPRQS